MRERPEPQRGAFGVGADRHAELRALQPHGLLLGACAPARTLIAGVDPEAPAFDRPDRELVRRPRRPGLGRERHERHEVGPRGALGHVPARGPGAVVRLRVGRSSRDEILRRLRFAPSHSPPMMAGELRVRAP